MREADLRLVGNSLELGFIELLSECFTLSEQAGVGSKQLMELIKDQHKSPALLRYADRITENRFDSRGGFNLAGGIADARYVYLTLYLLLFCSLHLRQTPVAAVDDLSVHPNGTGPTCPTIGTVLYRRLRRSVFSRDHCFEQASQNRSRPSLFAQ
jgi:hypothetical protein